MQLRKIFQAVSLLSVGAFAVALPVAAQDTQRQPVQGMTDLTAGGNLPLARVGPQDLIGIQVYDAPEFTRTVRVSDEGTIRLPMLKGTIRVQGLMPNEIELLLAEALQREMLFVDPFVTINIVEYHSRPINVAGAVRSPTIFQAVGTVTLLDALARAGGILPDAAGSEIIVTKQNGDTNTQSIQRIPVKALIEGSDPQLNLKLVGGEEVRVPDVGKLIVAGSVVHPGPYPILDSNVNTVRTAIAQAQGTIQYFSHTAFIYRPDEKGQMHEIQVDLGKILARKAPDVTLQARDILYVPDSSGRRITQTTINALTGVSSSAAVASIYLAR